MLTWTDTGAGLQAFDGDLLVGQVVRCDQEPPYGAFLRGIRVGAAGKRYGTQEEARAAVERAWAGQRRRQAPDAAARENAEAERRHRSDVMARSVSWPSRRPKE